MYVESFMPGVLAAPCDSSSRKKEQKIARLTRVARSSNLLRFALRLRQGLTGRKIRPRRLGRRMVEPRALERDYLALILKQLDLAKALVRERLIPEIPTLAYEARRDAMRADGFADVLAAIFDGIEAALVDAIPRDRELRGNVETVGLRVSEHSRREVSAQIRHMTGLDVPAFVPGLEDRIQVFARQNAQLIKSVPVDYLYDIEQATLRAFREGKRAEELAGILEDRYRVAQNRSALIAVDQIGKLNGEITKERQTGLGLTRYRWRTAGDERVRPEHAARDGEPFSWDDPPVGGHPGQDYRCRCWADPVVEDLLGE